MNNYIEDAALAGYDAARQEIVRNVIGALPERTCLQYVDYRDALDVETSQAWLEDDWEVLYDKIDEWYFEASWFAESDYLGAACQDAGVDRDSLSDDEEEEIRQEIRERDASEPIAALVRNTDNYLFRAQLVKPYPLPPGTFGDDCEAREVIWYGSLEDAKETRQGGRFRFTGGPSSQAYYLARDGVCGGGGDYPMPKDIVLEIEPDTTQLDEAPGAGYSWTEIAGPSPMAYATNITKED